MSNPSKITVNISDNRINNKDLLKLLKEKYNLKVQAIFYALLENPDLLEEIDSMIDPHDRSFRFCNRM